MNDKKQISARVDTRVYEEFKDWCAKDGLLVERVIEAMCHHAATLKRADYWVLRDAATEFIDAGEAGEAGADSTPAADLDAAGEAARPAEAARKRKKAAVQPIRGRA